MARESASGSRRYRELHGGGQRAAPRRSTFGRVAATGLAVGALMAVGYFYRRPADPPPSLTPQPAAVLELARGPVRVLPAGMAAGAAGEPVSIAGYRLYAGAAIDTGGGGASRAAFRLAGGSSLRLDADTRVRMVSSSVLTLEQGAVYVDSPENGSGVEVRTALGVVSAIETRTQFEVRLLPGTGDPSLRVRVREGVVRVESGEEAHIAAAGEEIAIRPSGTLARDFSSTYGSHWSWVLETAPPPEIEGRVLRHFLDWIAREGGWKLRFADSRTAELASAVTLHGKLEGMTPIEAATMVLLGSHLQYRLVEGAFIVEPIGLGES